MNLADLLGGNTAEWMENPGRKCATSPDLDPKEAGEFADWWFPTEVRGVAATKLCGGCPVINECLAYALTNPEVEGIWGGTTDNGRAILRRKAGDRHGTYAEYLAHHDRGEKACRRCSQANATEQRRSARAEKAATDAA